MSRKWERMVRRNRKITNNQRKKFGKQPITEAASSDGAVTFRGRSWFLPLMLVLTGIFCFIAFRGTQQDENLYWITGGSYLFLGLFIFWLRRPYLKIGKDFVSSRRFGGDRTLMFNEISEISLHKDSVTIGAKGKNNRWVFTRLYHRFDVEAMKEGLKEFAETHSIALKQE